MFSFFLIANIVISVAFFLGNALQFFYVFVSLFRKPETFSAAPPGRRYAVLICARNEEAVIGHLVQSVKEQDYPQELIETFVLADNCDDGTARAAAEAGARVYVRQDAGQIGKGYALHSLLEQMGRETLAGFDACIVVDADNLLARDYISRMNDCFSTGRWRVITSYRNSKNFGVNWLTAGSALCYIRESRQLNAGRQLMHTSCGVNGTGFLVASQVLLEAGGWNYFRLLEDIDFTMDCVIRGETIGYCHDAILYDEQPDRLAQSWRQHIRWIRGYLQLLHHYGGKLIRGSFQGSQRLACFDFLMVLGPACFLSMAAIVLNAVAIVYLAIAEEWVLLLLTVGGMLLGTYVMVLFLGVVLTVTEWERIRCSAGKKVLYALLFPIFMILFAFETIPGLFSPIQWKPIAHTDAVGLDELEHRGDGHK